ncbi:MAG: isochorismatase family protein [Dermatophilus congolensis]|nr:isochorismatase family protein [Dermatophilus congolensis]
MTTERDRHLRMSAEHSVLVLIDYQARLMPAIYDRERVTRRAAFLASVAGELGVPVVATAQNPDKLGANVDAIASRCDAVVDKLAFGACEDGLIAQLDALRPDAEVVIGGCEAHVCLMQTALGLLEAGRTVWVLSDASGSRRPGDRKAAMRRLSDSGAKVVTTEMAAFEWLNTSADEHFRAVSALVKGTD